MRTGARAAAGPFRRTVAWMSRTRLFRALGPRMMPLAEAVGRVFTRGGTPISGVVVPSLTLHTIGARSGEPRSTALMCLPEDDGTIVVVGSNFARPEHPAWTYNLLAHPDAEVDFRGSRRAVRAELIGAGEREAVWARLEAQWPGYRAYERAAERELRMFRLIPR